MGLKCSCHVRHVANTPIFLFDGSLTLVQLKKHLKALIWLIFFVKFYNYILHNVSQCDII